MRTSNVLSFFLSVLGFICVQKLCGQQEILPLPLDRLNSDSLNNIIQQKEKAKDNKALGILYGGIYNYYLYSNHRDSAIMYAVKAEENAYKAGDSTRYYFILLQLGDFYTNSLDFKNAAVYFEKALHYYTRIKNYTFQSTSLGALSYMYGLKKDTVSQLRYLDLAEKVIIISKDTFNMVGANDKRAGIMMNKNQLDTAIFLLRKNLLLLTHVKTFGNGEHIRAFWKGWQLNKLAECYFRKKNYEFAINYLKEALPYDYQTSDFDAQNIFRYRFLINSYIQLKEKDSAIKYTNLFFEQTIKTLQNLKPEKLNEISIKYETEKKQRQIAELQQKNHLQQITASTQRKLNLAFISIILLVLITGYLVIRNIQNKKKIAFQLAKQHAELEKKQLVESERVRISTELHDDIGGELSAIRLLSEMNTTIISPQQQLSKISSSSGEMVQKMNEIVWALNVNKDSLQSLVSYIRLYVVKYLDDLGIDCLFEQPDKIPEREVDGVTRRNIFLLIKEALNNVVKHANATAVHVTIALNERLQIDIHDNGKGIPEDMLQYGTGNGLRNMQKRVMDLKGSMYIKNQSGTSLQFDLPFQGNNTKG